MCATLPRTSAFSDWWSGWGCWRMRWSLARQRAPPAGHRHLPSLPWLPRLNLHHLKSRSHCPLLKPRPQQQRPIPTPPQLLPASPISNEASRPNPTLNGVVVASSPRIGSIYQNGWLLSDRGLYLSPRCRGITRTRSTMRLTKMRVLGVEMRVRVLCRAACSSHLAWCHFRRLGCVNSWLVRIYHLHRLPQPSPELLTMTRTPNNEETPSSA